MRLAFLAISPCDRRLRRIEHPSGLIPRWTTAYREVISEDDHVRLRDWRRRSLPALEAARKSGHGDEIVREGALLDPDAALANAGNPQRHVPLPSDQARSEGRRQSRLCLPIPGFTCRVRPEETLQRLGKLSGSQRYVGVIFPGDAIRNVFLGTLAFADETRALQYGQDDAGRRRLCRADRPQPLAAGHAAAPFRVEKST